MIVAIYGYIMSTPEITELLVVYANRRCYNIYVHSYGGYIATTGEMASGCIAFLLLPIHVTAWIGPQIWTTIYVAFQIF